MDKKEKSSRKIRSMKKYVDFRNILVHMYEEVDINNCFYRSAMVGNWKITRGEFKDE